MVMDTANKKNKGREAAAPACLLALLLLSPALHAEEEELAQGWQMTPRLTLSETFTDNIELEPDGDADLVTEISPGVNLSKQGGRSRVEFDYELKMTPSFSFINPYEEHWVPWVLKEKMLQAAYLAMLRGRV